MDKTDILRMRMHGLYITRECNSLEQLSKELLGMHCWFHRNVVFPALIRGADIVGWKDKLTKTWLYRGTLHGVAYDDLPMLLALHADELPYSWFGISPQEAEYVAERVLTLMEDGVYSRREMRQIFSYDYDPEIVERLFSPWGGIFVYLARHGRVAFRNMTSRDFDLIAAEPSLSPEEALPLLLRRYFKAFGPATLTDASWFFGLDREQAKSLKHMDLDDLDRAEIDGATYYYCEKDEETREIPRLQLLSGFDPLVVSYVDRSAILPDEYRKKVILSSGICLPSVAVDGKIAGIWNIKKNVPTVEFFTPQPEKLKRAALEMVDELRWRSNGMM